MKLSGICYGLLLSLTLYAGNLFAYNVESIEGMLQVYGDKLFYGIGRNLLLERMDNDDLEMWHNMLLGVRTVVADSKLKEITNIYNDLIGISAVLTSTIKVTWNSVITAACTSGTCKNYLKMSQPKIPSTRYLDKSIITENLPSLNQFKANLENDMKKFKNIYNGIEGTTSDLDEWVVMGSGESQTQKDALHLLKIVAVILERALDKVIGNYKQLEDYA